MKRIAMVVQRYGLEVNGGAEYHARLLAEKLSERYSVEVLTTCAKDHNTWSNEYSEGLHIVNGITVRRFLSLPKNHKKFRQIRRMLLEKTFPVKFLNTAKRKLGIFPSNIGLLFLQHQGPHTPTLVDFIYDHQADYDRFIFFTYLYYPTVAAMPMVKEKAIFIPTAHDEEMLFTTPFSNIFRDTGFIMYNTKAEKNLIESHFANRCTKNAVAGIGIEKYNGTKVALPEGIISKKYFVYIGRIQGDKGCNLLIEFFRKFKAANPEYAEVKLVFVGNNYLKESVEDHDIYFLGFVEEELKYTLLDHAIALIMPSFYESLSLVTLEAMSMGTPVIVNGNCEVLKNHTEESRSGRFFTDYDQFKSALIHYLEAKPEDIHQEAIRAATYVQDHYSWEKIIEKFDKAINDGDPQ